MVRTIGQRTRRITRAVRNCRLSRQQKSACQHEHRGQPDDVLMRIHELGELKKGSQRPDQFWHRNHATQRRAAAAQTSRKRPGHPLRRTAGTPDSATHRRPCVATPRRGRDRWPKPVKFYPGCLRPRQPEPALRTSGKIGQGGGSARRQNFRL